jgi:hypothetical protein
MDIPQAPDKSCTGVRSRRFEIWNRKLHYYLGLYLLLFLWLFAFTGLLLNHPKWEFAKFWPQRKESTFVRPIETPSAAEDFAQARDLMRQLQLSGELDWITPKQEPGRLDFRVSKPGRIIDVRTDLVQREAAVSRIETNGWGVIRMLHTFTGVRMNNSRMKRDWVVTSIWSFSMDAVAAGLLLMVLSSYYMWYRLEKKKRLGLIALSVGALSCSLFVVGLVWLDRIG